MNDQKEDISPSHENSKIGASKSPRWKSQDTYSIKKTPLRPYEKGNNSQITYLIKKTNKKISNLRGDSQTLPQDYQEAYPPIKDYSPEKIPSKKITDDISSELIEEWEKYI